MKIALDWDGVISDFVTPMCAYLRANGHLDALPEAITHWDFATCILSLGPMAWDDLYNDYLRADRLHEQPDHPDAVRAIEELARWGHEMRIFTVRPREHSPKSWRGPGHIELPVTFCDDAKHKAERVIDWGAEVFVDDLVECTDAVVSKDTACICFERRRTWTGQRGYACGVITDATGWTPLLDYVRKTTAQRGSTPGSGHIIKDSGERREFDTGSVRDVRTGKGRFDLLPPAAMTRLAQHFERGAVKYGDNNWRKGQPLSTFIDSAARHINAVTALAHDEDHATAAAWNMLAFVQTVCDIEADTLPISLDDIGWFDAPIQFKEGNTR